MFQDHVRESAYVDMQSTSLLIMLHQTSSQSRSTTHVRGNLESKYIGHEQPNALLGSPHTSTRTLSRRMEDGGEDEDEDHF